MRAVVQRVSRASVEIEGEVIGAIDQGWLVYLGVEDSDTEDDARYIANKVIGLRCFNDVNGRFNLGVTDIGGSVLVVSQFTLHGDCRRGRRPSFTSAARPEHAIPLYESVIRRIADAGIPVATGFFGAHMAVSSLNDGPVTLLLESRGLF